MRAEHLEQTWIYHIYQDSFRYRGKPAEKNEKQYLQDLK